MHITHTSDDVRRYKYRWISVTKRHAYASERGKTSNHVNEEIKISIWILVEVKIKIYSAKSNEAEI